MEPSLIIIVNSIAGFTIGYLLSSEKYKVRARAALFSLNEDRVIFLSFLIIAIVVVLFSLPPLRQYWDSFYPAIMATFLGIFLGFTLDRIFTRAREKETLNRILISIMKELELNKKDLETFEFKDGTLYFTRVQSTAFDSAIGGGYFSLMDSETQNKLSVLYSNINHIAYMSDRILLMREQDVDILSEINSALGEKLCASLQEHEELIKYLRVRVRLKP